MANRVGFSYTAYKSVLKQNQQILKEIHLIKHHQDMLLSIIK